MVTIRRACGPGQYLVDAVNLIVGDAFKDLGELV